MFLEPSRGMVFSCNEVGALIWEALRDGRGFERLIPELAGQYGVPETVVAEDATRFIGELETAGILLRNRRS